MKRIDWKRSKGRQRRTEKRMGGYIGQSTLKSVWMQTLVRKGTGMLETIGKIGRSKTGLIWMTYFEYIFRIKRNLSIFK
jgi:hypothetical protein